MSFLNPIYYFLTILHLNNSDGVNFRKLTTVKIVDLNATWITFFTHLITYSLIRYLLPIIKPI